MNNICCTKCRLRFTPAAAAQLLACPECGGSPRAIPAREDMLGFRLDRFDDAPESWLQARAVALPVHDPSEGRS
jgi:hypothetical protein